MRVMFSEGGVLKGGCEVGAESRECVYSDYRLFIRLCGLSENKGSREAIVRVRKQIMRQ